MRTYSPSPTVTAPELPLHELGCCAPVAQMRQSVSAPQIPLYQLGWLGAGTTQVIAPVAVKAGSAVATAAGAGSWAGPIGAGVGAVIGVIAGLWAAHSARAKGAKSENAAVNSAVQAYDASLRAIFDAANKGNISSQDAITALEQVEQQYFQSMAPYQVGPGRSDASHGGTACTPNLCTAGNTHCTAGCCVGCNNILPDISDAIAIFQNGGGTLTVRGVGGLAKYGAVPRSSYTLTYKAPAASSSVTSLAHSLTADLGGISILPLLILGGLAIAFMGGRS